MFQWIPNPYNSAFILLLIIFVSLAEVNIFSSFWILLFECRKIFSKLWWLMPVFVATWEDRGSSPAWANSSRNLISKITRAKWTGGVAQVVEYLLCKREVLSSNTSLIRRQKNIQNSFPSFNKYFFKRRIL
jgi:hypothetical protein